MLDTFEFRFGSLLVCAGALLKLQAFLVGDVVYTTAAILYCYSIRLQSFEALFNIGFSCVLLVFRILCIITLEREGRNKPNRTDGFQKDL